MHFRACSAVGRIVAPLKILHIDILQPEEKELLKSKFRTYSKQAEVFKALALTDVSSLPCLKGIVDKLL